jgi:competence protein ComGC
MKLKTKNTSRGFTLTELVVFIIVSGIVFIPFLLILTNLNERSTHTDMRTTMTNLAMERMDIIRSKAFDQNAEAPYTAPANLGPDIGEEGLSDYNDCDDFKGLIETGATLSDFPNFTRTSDVHYADTSGGEIVDVLTETKLKRIVVTVSHAEYIDVEVHSLMSAREILK